MAYIRPDGNDVKSYVEIKHMSDRKNTNHTPQHPNTLNEELRHGWTEIKKSWDGGTNSAEPNSTTNKGPLDD